MEEIGKFRVEQMIGTGAMGSVFRGYDTLLQRTVALKLIRADHRSDPIRRAMFAREALAIARLSHPNIVQVYEHGKTPDGQLYTAMELLEGESLDARLVRESRLKLRTLAPLLREVARGLQAAHTAGLIHRDLKPANIFLARTSQGITAKILDFGVAAARDDDIKADQTPQVVGTPSYMSPEQMAGRRLDGASDLWSLAVILHRAWTGRVPFDGEGIEAIRASILAEDRPRPSELLEAGGALRASEPHRELGPRAQQIDDFFATALHLSPERRFSNALELSAAFDQLVPNLGRSACTKVLVVDDEPDECVLFEFQFREKIARGEFEFVFATDSASAVQTLVDHADFDLMLTDIRMPGTDGLTLLDRVRELRPLLPTIVISAYDDMSNIRRAMNYGASDFLTKPFNFQELEGTMRKVVDQSHQAIEHHRTNSENAYLRSFVHPEALRARPGATVGPTSLVPRIDAMTLLRIELPDLADAREELEALARAPHSEVGAMPTPDAWLRAQQTVRDFNARIDVIAQRIEEHGGEIFEIESGVVWARFDHDASGSSPARCTAQIVADLHEPGHTRHHTNLKAALCDTTLLHATFGTAKSQIFRVLSYGEGLQQTRGDCQRAEPGEIIVRGRCAETLLDLGQQHREIDGHGPSQAPAWAIQGFSQLSVATDVGDEATHTTLAMSD